MVVLLKYLDSLSKGILGFCLILVMSSCNETGSSKRVSVLSSTIEANLNVIPAAENVAEYYDLLKDKKVALVVNQTSIIGNVHLVDSLLDLKVDIKTIFAPEHGFRGKADAGENIKDGIDTKSGLSVISLYGKKKKPSASDLEGVDVILFDIQDVGARFYTYISSLHYIMEACAENDIQLIVLDRPNPNGNYIDGPIMEKKYSSFIGMHPVPVIYGMTIGEYAQMINGEGWLSNGLEAELTIIPVRNYTHETYYELPIKPSPNLPNIQSILLYPSLCFFEGTNVSIGRGTNSQFQVVGHPQFSNGTYTFKPTSMEGAKYPKQEGVECKGLDLQNLTKGSLHQNKKLDLSYLISFYKNLSDQNVEFFLKTNFFEKLAGTDQLRKQIVEGLTEEEIRASWSDGLEDFQKIRAKYLIYD